VTVVVAFFPCRWLREISEKSQNFLRTFPALSVFTGVGSAIATTK
jgi:hypothetical protein